MRYCRKTHDKVLLAPLHRSAQRTAATMPIALASPEGSKIKNHSTGCPTRPHAIKAIIEAMLITRLPAATFQYRFPFGFPEKISSVSAPLACKSLPHSWQ
jgi:hypothetical protein